MRAACAALAAGSLLLLAGCDSGPDRGRGSAEDRYARLLPPGATEASLMEGQRIYLTHGRCYTCHGFYGEGTILAPALVEAEWRHVREDTLEEIVEVIREGVAEPVTILEPMPPLGGARLDESELHAVATYVFAISRRTRR